MTTQQPFERVVAAHATTVLRVCRAVVGMHADADDAWSETFLSAMRHYPTLPPGANVEAWLVTIAHRKAVDVLRARRRRPIPVDEVPELPGGPEPAVDGPHELWDVVKRLPEKQRQAVAYRYLGGLSYREIAEVLGGTPDAARKAASDGIKHLRAHHRPAETERTRSGAGAGSRGVAR